MEKKYDVIAMGELLVDSTMNGKSEQGNDLFEACPGRRAMQCAGNVEQTWKENGISRKGRKGSVWNAFARHTAESRDQHVQSADG